MSDRVPRYPIYIPSKGRYDKCLTAISLVQDGVPFRLVVEPQERAEYERRFGRRRVLVLPFSNRGSVIPARNWIKGHSIAEGHERHWQLDDNMRGIVRMWRGKKIPCDAGTALSVVEDFADRYENVAIAGLNYRFFNAGAIPAFFLNVHVYSCCLILNSIPYQWRGRYNEDTDLCLQVLTGGWCTVLINAFLVNKQRTMTMGGGNTATLYQADGRLRMSRSLERLWPGVVETKRRYQRPQHWIKDSWGKFDTPLKLKDGIELADAVDEYGLRLVQRRSIKSPRLVQIVADRLKSDRARSESAADTERERTDL